MTLKHFKGIMNGGLWQCLLLVSISWIPCYPQMFSSHSNVILVTVTKNFLRELTDFQTTGKWFHLFYL